MINIAVQLDKFGRAGRSVQPVDVLGNQRECIEPVTLLRLGDR